MPIVPYKPDLEAWKHHFKNLDNGKQLQIVKTSKKPEETTKSPFVVETVSPTQQTIERAEALVAKQKKKKKPKHPWTKYGV